MFISPQTVKNMIGEMKNKKEMMRRSRTALVYALLRDGDVYIEPNYDALNDKLTEIGELLLEIRGAI